MLSSSLHCNFYWFLYMHQDTLAPPKFVIMWVIVRDKHSLLGCLIFFPWPAMCLGVLWTCPHCPLNTPCAPNMAGSSPLSGPFPVPALSLPRTPVGWLHSSHVALPYSWSSYSRVFSISVALHFLVLVWHSTWRRSPQLDDLLSRTCRASLLLVYFLSTCSSWDIFSLPSFLKDILASLV